MSYTIVSICLAWMIYLVASFAYKFVKANRINRLKLVKGYAKKRFILIYICAIPLFLMALLYDGAKVIEAIFGAVEASVDLVVLKLDYSVVEALVESNAYYATVMVILFALCVVNIAMVTATLGYQKIVNYHNVRLGTAKDCNTIVVVGVNEKNREILKSCTGKKIWVMAKKEKTEEIEEFAYVNKTAIVYMKSKFLADTMKKLFGDEYVGRAVKVILNTGSDEQNLLFVEELTEIIKAVNVDLLDVEGNYGLKVYAFGEPENSSAFIHFVKKSSGQVQYVNKYKLVAFDFVDKHPLTEYMGANEIDYATATLKADVDVNVVMVGYNKTMQEVLLTSIANNQFASLDENGNVVERPVKYSVFSRTKMKTTEKNINHTYFRYAVERTEMLSKEVEYLSLPSLPADVDFVPVDVNDHDFYAKVKGALAPKDTDRKVFNQIIVAYGTDIENVDIAEKLSVRVKEWGLDGATKVFVKVRSDDLANKIVKEEYKEICELITFASEKEIVYNVKNIISENFESMARDRHLAYAVCDALQDGRNEQEAKAKALKKWYNWAQPQRDANVYGVLSLRMKLNLMGYDYEKGTSDAKINKEFMEKYTFGDEIRYKEGAVGGKKLIIYDNNFVKGSLRERMAIQEHQRWNAYMITQGVVPSSKAQMEKEGGKNLELRRHGCLTTFEGLIEYRQIMAKRNATNEEMEDVIRYDYQMLDDAIWLLERNGNAIVKR